ncbi:hypothetical protein B0H67DRAFT_564784 [Lasiosphaeris hirsuta]|uniref:Uncharacterized protein n=1 Tax=Lasiosphaeris hirsuta TaxID=260670 RepID=A0AA40BBW2_9PEZI|nr:hypothetical protein B0H67DRAFT_564784 [Lasiosphaeris hirsuta]
MAVASFDSTSVGMYIHWSLPTTRAASTALRPGCTDVYNEPPDRAVAGNGHFCLALKVIQSPLPIGRQLSRTPCTISSKEPRKTSEFASANPVLSLFKAPSHIGYPATTGRLGCLQAAAQRAVEAAAKIEMVLGVLDKDGYQNMVGSRGLDASRAYTSSARQHVCMYNGDTWRYPLDFRLGHPVPHPSSQSVMCWPLPTLPAHISILTGPRLPSLLECFLLPRFPGQDQLCVFKSSRASPARARVQVKSSMNGKRHLPSQASLHIIPASSWPLLHSQSKVGDGWNATCQSSTIQISKSIVILSGCYPFAYCAGRSGKPRLVTSRPLTWPSCIPRVMNRRNPAKREDEAGGGEIESTR